MDQVKQDNRERVNDYFKSKTPAFVVTKSDDWIGGYIAEEPQELFFYILDWKTKKAIKVHYSDIHLFREWEGDLTSLPLPDYLKSEETA